MKHEFLLLKSIKISFGLIDKTYITKFSKTILVRIIFI